MLVKFVLDDIFLVFRNKISSFPFKSRINARCDRLCVLKLCELNFCLCDKLSVTVTIVCDNLSINNLDVMTTFLLQVTRSFYTKNCRELLLYSYA